MTSADRLAVVANDAICAPLSGGPSLIWRQRMMRAVLRGDAAAALRWRRVELVLGAKQAEVDAFIAEDDASTRNLRQQTELEDWLDECAEARRGIDADPDSPDTPDTVFESGSAPGPTGSTDL
eukprot:gene3118-biopygen2594